MGAFFFCGLLVPRFGQDLVHGSRLSALGLAPRRLLFCEIVNALCWKSNFLAFGEIWLLAHASRPRSQRLGADFF